MSEMDGRSTFALTPWVRRLIAANAVVYLLTITVFTGSWFFQTFAFTPYTALVQPWTFVTYTFVHGGFLHLAFNMLMLFFFGPAVEERMGGRAFLWYYLFCGLGGAALSFAIALAAPVAPFVGASGAVFGVALAFALNWPDAPILVFPLPVPIKAKWLVLGLAAIDLALAVLPARDGVAHLAHLGGFLFGFLYLRAASLAARVPGAAPRRRTRARARSVQTGAEGGRRRDGSRRPALRPDETIQAKIDRLLDKISATGIDSLTPEERQLLAERSRQLRQH
ncbi:MAG: rhomboid family intramembrane serine protease [Gemmatimonadetes bacterium]|nr:rhomboid family intramembrane serine protease [Gemmatimonadota bacterium]MBI2403898.1 rhomboid family intramembrane serine protease [Gemmatimonadota bacterium]